MQKASEGFRWQELSLFLATLNWVLCEPHQDKASEMFRGNVLKWSPSKLSLNLGHLMLVPLSHFFSVWQCPMLSRDNSRKHDSIILSRSFFSAWVTSRAPSDQEVIRDLVPDPNPELEEEEVSRLFRESLDIQGHGSRYYHHSDREAFLATQAHGHGSQQHSLKLKKLLNFFCKRNYSDYFMLRFEARLRARGAWMWSGSFPEPDWDEARSEPSQRAALRPRFAELWPLCRASIAIIATHCHSHYPGTQHHTQPLEASWCLPGPVQAVMASEARFNNKMVIHANIVNYEKYIYISPPLC